MCNFCCFILDGKCHALQVRNSLSLMKLIRKFYMLTLSFSTQRHSFQDVIWNWDYFLHSVVYSHIKRTAHSDEPLAFLGWVQTNGPCQFLTRWPATYKHFTTFSSRPVCYGFGQETFQTRRCNKWKPLKGYHQSSFRTSLSLYSELSIKTSKTTSPLGRNINLIWRRWYFCNEIKNMSEKWNVLIFSRKNPYFVRIAQNVFKVPADNCNINWNSPKFAQLTKSGGLRTTHAAKF